MIVTCVGARLALSALVDDAGKCSGGPCFGGGGMLAGTIQGAGGAADAAAAGCTDFGVAGISQELADPVDMAGLSQPPDDPCELFHEFAPAPAS